MIPTNTTLIKYDEPQLVTRHAEKPYKDQKPFGNAKGDGPVPCPMVSNKLPTIDSSAPQATVEILNTILPPKEFMDEHNTLWIMPCSSTPATRIEVINLQTELDRRLLQRQARETGICPVRRELYTQCFDEVIRQVTINCAERGLLLVRIRDELKMTIAAYQTLYESSVGFGMRKALQAEQGKSELEKRIIEMENDRRDLERLVNELKIKSEQTDKRANEQKLVDEKKHAEEVQFLKKTNQQLKTQLEGIIAPKK